MPRTRKKDKSQEIAQGTLFDLPGAGGAPAPPTPGALEGCPHVNHPTARKNWFWELETDPGSPYYREYVHIAVGCRRSAIPGRHKR